MKNLLREIADRREPSTEDGAGESGFTLIELMVVVLIIAILMAIAIPTFLGAKNTAQDSGAQQDAQNALTNAQTISAANNGVLSSVTATSLQSADPALNVPTTCAASANSICVGSGTNTTSNYTYVQLCVTSSAGNAWVVSQTSDGPAWYGEDKGANCTALTLGDPGAHGAGTTGKPTAPSTITDWANQWP